MTAFVSRSYILSLVLAAGMLATSPAAAQKSRGITKRVKQSQRTRTGPQRYTLVNRRNRLGKTRSAKTQNRLGKALATARNQAKTAKAKTAKAKTKAKTAEEAKATKARTTKAKAETTKTKTKAEATKAKAKTTKSKTRTTKAKAETTKTKTAKAKAETTKTKTKAEATKAKAKAKSKSPDSSPRLTRRQREKVATDRVKEVLKPWVPRGVSLNVRLAPMQIQLNADNKLIGRGPVEVVVSPKIRKGTGLIKRLLLRFNPTLNRRMYVGVNRLGNGTVLADIPNGLANQVYRVVSRVLPVREIALDLVGSKTARAGILTAVASVLAFQVSPEAGIVGIMSGVGMIRSGLKRRAESRETALTQTVEWAQNRRTTPVLSESYRYYKLQLQKTSQGTKPIAFGRFVERLTLHEFTPASATAKE